MAKRLWDKGAEVDNLVHHFTIGQDPTLDLVLVEHDLVASAAHAKMLKKIGILDGQELKALLDEMSSLVDLSKSGAFEIPYELEDCHSAIENALVEKIGQVGKKVHTGRSRNDQVLVASRLWLRSSVITCLEELIALADTLAERAQREGQHIFPGYTHLQKAMPSSIGMWLMSYSEHILELLAEGVSLLKGININPLGAASGFGVPLPLDRSYTAELLGFSKVQRNPINVQNSRGRMELRALSWLSEISSLVEKMAWDIQLFCTSEFGFISLEDKFTTGSSIMPQKRNPDVAELLRARSSMIRGYRSELEWIVSKLPSSYHRDFQLSKASTQNAFSNSIECLVVLERLTSGMTFNLDAMSKAMTLDLFATYDVYRRVKEGMAFRDAYLATGKEYREGTLKVDQVASEVEFLHGEVARESQEFNKEFQTIKLEISEITSAIAKKLSGIFKQ